jgi:predicted dehydrogenase
MSEHKAPCRIGLVGAGNISRLHLDGLRRHGDRARAIALCDPDPKSLAQRVADYQVPRTFTDLTAMIRGTKLDAAIVCTPTHIREPMVVTLLETGIPVLCEKPFAETYAEAARMEQASRRTGVRLAVNQNFRRHFSFALAREALDRGSLGRPLHLAQMVTGLRHDAG